MDGKTNQGIEIFRLNGAAYGGFGSLRRGKSSSAGMYRFNTTFMPYLVVCLCTKSKQISLADLEMKVTNIQAQTISY